MTLSQRTLIVLWLHDFPHNLGFSNLTHPGPILDPRDFCQFTHEMILKTCSQSEGICLVVPGERRGSSSIVCPDIQHIQTTLDSQCTSAID